MPPHVPHDQTLFKVSEVAALLKMPTRTIYDYIARGVIPADHVVRFGRALRVKRGYLRPILDDATPAAVAS